MTPVLAVSLAALVLSNLFSAACPAPCPQAAQTGSDAAPREIAADAPALGGHGDAVAVCRARSTVSSRSKVSR